MAKAIPLGHGAMQRKRVKSVIISVLRLKWSTHIKKAVATCHFSIMLISLKRG